MIIETLLRHDVKVTRHFIMDDNSVDYRIKFIPGIMIGGSVHDIITMNVKVDKDESICETFDMFRFRNMDLSHSSLRCMFNSDEELLNAMMKVVSQYNRENHFSINSNLLKTNCN